MLWGAKSHRPFRTFFRRIDFSPSNRHGQIVRTLRAVLLLLVAYLYPNFSYAEGYLNCGVPPVPQIGCRIGQCVNGQWQQICDSNPSISCGIPPVPEVGCRIGQCVDGQWQQICDSQPTMSCGIPPVPQVGCRIGQCVDGQWQQICN